MKTTPKLQGVLRRIPQAITSIVICALVFRSYPYIGLLPFYLLLTALAISAANELVMLMSIPPISVVRRMVVIASATTPVIVTGALIFSGQQRWAEVSTLLMGGVILFFIHAGLMTLYITHVERSLRNGAIGPQVIADALAHPMMKLAAYYAGIFYIGLPAGLVALFVGNPIGLTLIIYAVILTVIFDSLSFLCGVVFAKKKGVVAVSPQKSTAGYLGGGGGTLAAMIILIQLSPRIQLSLVTTVVVVSATIGAAIVGDLFESALKRGVNKKDSGRGVPGRGGVLDSIDSHLIAVPTFCALSLKVMQ